MAAALLAPGRHRRSRNVDPVADLDVMIDVLRAIGAAVEWSGPRELRDRRVGRPPRRGALRVGDADARVGQRARSAARALRRGAGRHARRRQHRQPASSTCTSAGSSRWASSCRSCTGSSRRAPTGSTAPGSCSSSRASAPPRTCSPPPCWPRARPSSRTRRGSRRSPTSRRCSTGMGARGRSGPARSTIEVEGVEALHPVDSEIMGDRIETGTLLMACGDRRRRDHARGRAARPRRDRRDEARRDGPAGVAHARRALGARRRAPARGRHRHAARSRASPPTSCRWRSRCSPTADGTAIVTENVFDNRLGFVAELNRMGADVRHEGRHAVVRGRGAAVGRAGAGARRARRRRAGARRARRRGRDGRARSVPRRPRLPRPRRVAARALGADVERVRA